MNSGNHGLLCDNEIRELAYTYNMIEPFSPCQESYKDNDKILSKGLSSFGYDISLGEEFKAYTSQNSVHQSVDKWALIVDPLNFNEDLLETFSVDPAIGYVILPPHGYFLGHSIEKIKMPNDVNALCLTKSTYARVGIFCNTTPLEAGWEGVITLEIANLTPRPVKIYPNQGICQIQFFRGNLPDITYAQRGGKYQNQVGITLAKG